MHKYHKWPQGGTLELWKWAPSERRGSLASVLLFRVGWSLCSIVITAWNVYMVKLLCVNPGIPDVKTEARQQCDLVRMMFSLRDIGIWQERSNELALESHM